MDQTRRPDVLIKTEIEYISVHLRQVYGWVLGWLTSCPYLALSVYLEYDSCSGTREDSEEQFWLLLSSNDGVILYHDIQIPDSV